MASTKNTHRTAQTCRTPRHNRHSENYFFMFFKTFFINVYSNSKMFEIHPQTWNQLLSQRARTTTRATCVPASPSSSTSCSPPPSCTETTTPGWHCYMFYYGLMLMMTESTIWVIHILNCYVKCVLLSLKIKPQPFLIKGETLWWCTVGIPFVSLSRKFTRYMSLSSNSKMSTLK